MRVFKIFGRYRHVPPLSVTDAVQMCMDRNTRDAEEGWLEVLELVRDSDLVVGTPSGCRIMRARVPVRLWTAACTCADRLYRDRHVVQVRLAHHVGEVRIYLDDPPVETLGELVPRPEDRWAAARPRRGTHRARGVNA